MPDNVRKPHAKKSNCAFKMLTFHMQNKCISTVIVAGCERMEDVASVVGWCREYWRIDFSISDVDSGKWGVMIFGKQFKYN